MRWLCDACREDSTGPGFAVALHHPAVSAFLRDHGMELRRGSWEFMEIAGSITEHVESTDPVLVSYALDYEDATLELAVDGDGTVTTVDV